MHLYSGIGGKYGVKQMRTIAVLSVDVSGNGLFQLPISLVPICTPIMMSDRRDMPRQITVFRSGSSLDGRVGRHAVYRDDYTELVYTLQSIKWQPCHSITQSSHLITSSALRRIDCGIVSPSILAVLRLITSSNLVGCSTGRSAGRAPSKIRTT